MSSFENIIEKSKLQNNIEIIKQIEKTKKFEIEETKNAFEKNEDIGWGSSEESLKIESFNDKISND